MAHKRNSLLVRQPRFCETLGNPQDVLFFLKRLPGEMFANSIQENLIPRNSRILPIFGRYLFRLTAKRENRLRRRCTRHDRSPPLGLKAELTNQRLKWPSLR